MEMSAGEATMAELNRIARVAGPFLIHWIYLTSICFIGAFLANRVRVLRHYKNALNNRHIIYYAMITAAIVKAVDVFWISDALANQGLVTALALIGGVLSQGVVIILLKHDTALKFCKAIINSDILKTLHDEVIKEVSHEDTEPADADEPKSEDESSGE